MSLETVGPSILKSVYKKRPDWSHKYNYGHLLVVGGSIRYSGSPALNAMAALRSGVDLVTVAAPERASNIIASFGPDLIAYPLRGDYITEENLPDIFSLLEKKTAVVIGGGLTRNVETLAAVLKFLKEVKIPVVIDADAIHAVSIEKEILKGKNWILTPHIKEFQSISNIELGNYLQGRVESVEETAKKLNVTILLKGHVDIVSNGQKTYLVKGGSPYMTKGGMGDTLAGICGAILARGVNTITAACAASYINKKAGEMACKENKEGVIASDILKFIPKVIYQAIKNEK